MPDHHSARPLSVSLLVVAETAPFALYGLYEVFSSVGVAWSALTGEAEGTRALDVRIVAARRQPFPCAMGVPIAPHAAFDEVAASDLVAVPDLAIPVDADPRGRWPEAVPWLRRQFAAGATVCSVCSGSVLLADSGLLDGHAATTHWAFADLFARCFPRVTLRADRLVVPSGHEHRIVTSGGAAAWEDLALYLIARFCGEAEAVRIAKIFLFGDRSEGQLPYAAMARPRRHEDRIVADVQAWIADHYAGEAPVARMVARSGLPARTFKRRFKEATGYAPVDYVQTLRIEEAKHLLETTGTATDEVAHQVGYEDPTFFRRLFKRRTGVTPARYRQRFQAIALAHRQA